MSRITDQAFLRKDQYGDSSNLDARIALHQLYNTNPLPWHNWVRKQIEITPGMRILEVGCGPGDLWLAGPNPFPENILVCLGDISTGMLQQASQRIGDLPFFSYAAVDVQSLPYREHVFDTVIANHMLYHAPDIDLAIKNLARVLKSGGKLYAATNGSHHMQELWDLLDRFGLQGQHFHKTSMRYSLENAQTWLAPYFDKVVVEDFDANLKVLDVSILMAYIRSMSAFLGNENHPGLKNIEQFVQTAIDAHGFFFIRTSGGMVIASNSE